MESASTYYTRRARQERTRAADAGSAEARTAHLELALRLVRVATEPALWRRWPDPRRAEQKGDQLVAGESKDGVASALVDAVPLPTSGSFGGLLNAIDEADRSRAS